MHACEYARMLAKKLLVRPGSRVAVVGAPPTIDLVLPPEAKPADRGPADIVLVYTKNQAGVRPALAKAGKVMAEGGTLWIAYPKSGQLGTDLNRDSLARALQAEGLEPVTQIAVDDVWSALRVKRDALLTKARKARGAFGATAKRPQGKKTAANPKKKAATKKAAPKARIVAKPKTAKRPPGKKAAR